MRNATMPAYPHEDGPLARTGLTKREAIALAVLPAFVEPAKHTPCSARHAATCAVRFADALLAELEKQA